MFCLHLAILKFKFGLLKFYTSGMYMLSVISKGLKVFRKLEAFVPIRSPEYSEYHFRRYATFHACDAIASEAADLVVADKMWWKLNDGHERHMRAGEKDGIEPDGRFTR